MVTRSPDAYTKSLQDGRTVYYKGSGLQMSPPIQSSKPRLSMPPWNMSSPKTPRIVRC